MGSQISVETLKLVSVERGFTVFIYLALRKEMLKRQACGGFKIAVLNVLLCTSSKSSVRRRIRCQDSGEQETLIS